MTTLGPVTFVAAGGETSYQNPFTQAPASVTVNGGAVAGTLVGNRIQFSPALSAGDVVKITPSQSDKQEALEAASQNVEIVPVDYTPTDRSGNTAAAGASSTIMPANLSRAYWRIQNLSTTVDLWVNDKGGAASVSGAGCFKVQPGQMYEPPVSAISNAAIAVASASAIAFEATEYNS